MIISWENIDSFKVRSDGYFNRIGVSESLKYVKYSLIENCESCGDPYFVDIRKLKQNKGCFCSLKCFNSKQSLLRNNKKRKLKYHRYDIYYNQLQPYGVECRCKDNNILEVRCHKCKKWFVPYGNEVRSKCYSLKTGIGECNIYCSDECKRSCDTFRRKIYYPYQNNNQREIQQELRELVFERDNYTCQRCGKIGNKLHCHHIIPVKIDPVLSADVDNCITLCIECHKNEHKNGYTLGYLSNC